MYDINVIRANSTNFFLFCQKNVQSIESVFPSCLLDKRNEPRDQYCLQHSCLVEQPMLMQVANTHTHLHTSTHTHSLFLTLWTKMIKEKLKSIILHKKYYMHNTMLWPSPVCTHTLQALLLLFRIRKRHYSFIFF